jgi:26S proteasome regulatory subunit N7
VYEAVYLMLIRQFKPAALNLLDTLATFTTTELFSYQTFIYYTVIMSLVSLDRATIRSKVVHAPEILSVIREMPTLRKFMESLFRCEYAEFFKAFVEILDQVA